MKQIRSAVITTLAAMFFTSTAYAKDSEKPIVPAGPVYATTPVGEVQNNAVKAAKDRAKANANDDETRRRILEREAREAKEKADLKAAKAKDKADAAETEDLATKFSR